MGRSWRQWICILPEKRLDLLGVPLTLQVPRLKGNEGSGDCLPLPGLQLGLLASSSLALWACPVTSVAEQRPRPLLLPRAPQIHWEGDWDLPSARVPDG